MCQKYIQIVILLRKAINDYYNIFRDYGNMVNSNYVGNNQVTVISLKRRTGETMQAYEQLYRDSLTMQSQGGEQNDL